MAKIINTAELPEDMSPDLTSWIYNGLDCCLTLEICNNLKPKLDEEHLRTYALSKALQGPVLEMSCRGVLTDREYRQIVFREFSSHKEKIEQQLLEILEGVWGYTSFNYRSHMQIKDLLYSTMRLPEKKARKSNGSWGVTSNRDALEALQVHFYAQPVLNHILALRDLDKKLEVLETDIDADNHMRCNFNIAGTNTGRLASSASEFGTGRNLQNIEDLMRRIFVAPSGHKFCNIDLEQADSRNMGAACWESLAHLGDEIAGAYLDACESGDLHTTVTSMTWKDLPWDEYEVPREVADMNAYRSMSYRDLAKRLGHGTNYLGTPPTMAQHTKVETRIIREFQARYFKSFPCIPAFHEYTSAQLSDTRTMRNLFGRKRGFFGRPTDKKTQRDAVAYVGQSSTAEQINFGILRLFELNQVALLIQVHDSILFSYPARREAEIVPAAMEALTITKTLRDGRQFTVPVEAAVGWNWGKYKPKENPDGLQTWKGSDSRRRTRKAPGVNTWSLWD